MLQETDIYERLAVQGQGRASSQICRGHHRIECFRRILRRRDMRHRTSLELQQQNRSDTVRQSNYQ